jgi:FHA domain/GAF domain
MRLVIKQSGEPVKEATFNEGPVYLGRQMKNKIHLPDVSVSRQHAVITGPENGKWAIEDLDSANKTYVNDQAIHKSPLNDGDLIKISNFTLEVFMDDSLVKDNSPDMADTLTTVIHAPDKIIRRYTEIDSPDIRMIPKRAEHYSIATPAIFNTKDKQNLLDTLANLVFKQFDPFHVWVSFGPDPISPDLFIGRKKTGQLVNLDDFMFSKHIKESVKKKKYVLVPLVPRDNNPQRIRSAIVAPIIHNNEYLGVIYADNALKKVHYSLTDLDYLMLLAVQTAVKINSF